MKTHSVVTLCVCGLLGIGLAGGSAVGDEGLTSVGAVFRPDRHFPEFMGLWLEAWAQAQAGGATEEALRPKDLLGGYVQLYVRNQGEKPVVVSDVAIDGVNLSRSLVFAKDKVSGFLPASVRFPGVPKAELDTLLGAGEPVWWKVDPPTVPPGGFAEVTVRLRQPPTNKTVSVRVIGDTATMEARVEAGKEPPRFAGIAFAPSLDRAYLYPQRIDRPGTAPARILLDGTDVTVRSLRATDAAADITPVVVRLATPLARGSLHCFQAVYPDGTAAIACVRAWNDEFPYGMWGYINQGRTPAERVQYYLTDMRLHNINLFMDSIGKDVMEFLASEKGEQYARTNGVRVLSKWPGKPRNPMYYFLMDEPDAHDYAVKDLPVNLRLGSLGQDLVEHSRKIRARDPDAPHLLNIDNTYKPGNYYTYAQLPDVCCSDPYYQEQQKIVWSRRPGWASGFLKPTYVLAATTICQSACAPKPLHIILNSVRHDPSKGPDGRTPEHPAVFRFATPAEKRIELFYALAAGAKAFSYWWYTPYGEFYGCGGDTADARSLWREIGLLGAQVRTAGPLLLRGCPITLATKGSKYVWARSIACGTDSIVLLVVNDNFASDRTGTVMVPIEKATLTVRAPSWLEPKDAFAIGHEGLTEASWKNDAGQVAFDLGRLEVARMLVLTSDPQLRSALENLYQSRFAANVKALLSPARRK